MHGLRVGISTAPVPAIKLPITYSNSKKFKVESMCYIYMLKKGLFLGIDVTNGSGENYSFKALQIVKLHVH